MRHPAFRICFFLAAIVALASAAGAAEPAANYTITKTVPLGAPDRWDYLTYDSPSGRLYISHGDRVTVVDGKSGSNVGEVDGMPGGTHGIVITADAGRGYTDDGRAGEVVAFDLKTFKVIDRIKVHPDADGMIFDPASGHVFVIEGDTAKVTAIDPRTDKVIADIDGGGGLEFGVGGGNGKIYVNGAEKGDIVRIDTATNSADAHWPLPGCKSPHGLAIDHKNHRLFSSCANNVMLVVNFDTGAAIATLPIGAGTDAAGFDPKRGLAFSSNRDGTLSVIAEKSPDSFVALPPVTTQFGARTMAVDPDSGRIFLVTADFAANPNAAANDPRHRYIVTPGSTRLLILDPAIRLRQGSGGQ
jgi:DNA-binding beta-propeller fold protein YncE